MIITYGGTLNRPRQPRELFQPPPELLDGLVLGVAVGHARRAVAHEVLHHGVGQYSPSQVPLVPRRSSEWKSRSLQIASVTWCHWVSRRGFSDTD